MEKITIKPAEPKNSQQLFNLHQTTLWEPDNLLEDVDKWDYDLSAEKANISSHQKEKLPYLTAWIGNQIVGYALIDAGEYKKNQHVGAVEIFIRPEFRGQGLGKKLISALLKATQKNKTIKRIELEVWSNNQPALKLYQKIGFKIEGIRKRAYKINHHYIDGIIMAKWLK